MGSYLITEGFQTFEDKLESFRYNSLVFSIGMKVAITFNFVINY